MEDDFININTGITNEQYESLKTKPHVRSIPYTQPDIQSDTFLEGDENAEMPDISELQHLSRIEVQGIPKEIIDADYGRQLEKLGDIHEQILFRVARGYALVDISKELGISLETIRYTKSCRLGKERLEELRAMRNSTHEEYIASVEDYVPRAIERLGRVVTNPNSSDSDAIRASKEILGIVGVSPISKSMNINMNGYASIDKINELKENVKNFRAEKHIGTSKERNESESA